ncbi:hypothetical protein [Microcoleus sp. N3A4]|uniref:hypothetical protein n=1 Tax=Microcoleus sp. N3A4 TaxID=3055379 RepID=UPI002FD14F1B
MTEEQIQYSTNKISTNSSRDRRIKQIVLILSIALSIALLIVATRSADVPQLLRTVLIPSEDLGVWGPVAFIASYNLATILFIPGSVLTLGGGCFLVCGGDRYTSLSRQA